MEKGEANTLGYVLIVAVVGLVVILLLVMNSGLSGNIFYKGGLQKSNSYLQDQGYGKLDAEGNFKFVPPRKCKDSDGGNNPNVIGEVSFLGQVYYDACMTNKILEEKTCVCDSGGCRVVSLEVDCSKVGKEGFCDGTPVNLPPRDGHCI